MPVPENCEETGQVQEYKECINETIHLITEKEYRCTDEHGTYLLWVVVDETDLGLRCKTE